MEGSTDITIHLSTSYQSHYRRHTPDSNSPVPLPVQVTVRDNGPGITQDIISSIFDPFVTSKSHGKGLGLAIIARIVQQHGGLITAKNDPEGGASFTVSLPIAAKAGA